MARLVQAFAPLPAMPNTSVQNGARARVNINSGLAGYAHWLHQYVNGVLPVGNEQCSPYTGIGGPGHDHSGGILGRPIQHTFFIATFGTASTQLTNTTHGEGIHSGVTNAAPSASILGSPRLLFHGNVKTVRVPPGSPDGCYQRADFAATVRSDAACDLEITVTPEIGPEMSFTTTLASGVNHCVAGNNGRVNLIVGKRNRLLVKMELTYTAADALVTLCSFGLHQTRTSA